MKKFDPRILGGALLVVGGVLFLLQELEVVAVNQWVWPILFGIGSLLYLYVFLTDRAYWWAPIPGCALLGLTGLLVWEEVEPHSSDAWGATLFLSGIGLGFLLVYLRRRTFWWVIIPAGALFSVALATGLAPSLKLRAGGFLFLGLALTFAALHLARKPWERWPLITAGVLLIIGLVAIISPDVIEYLWPAALVGVGLYLLVRALRQ